MAAPKDMSVSYEHTNAQFWGQSVFADVIKDLEVILGSGWVIHQTSSVLNTEKRQRQQRGRPREEESRDWSYVATSQPEAT